jgi:hypothetical protein
MRHAPRALLAGGLGFAVAFLVACGGGAGLLSGDHASTLSAQLDKISAAVDAGRCSTASNAASALRIDVSALPKSVNAKLRRNLAQGAATVADLAEQDCHSKPKPTHTTSTATNTTPTNTTTTPTNTNTTTTQTQPQTNPATSPNTSTQPPVTNPSGPGTTSTGSSGGAGFGGGNTGGAGSGGNGQ